MKPLVCHESPCDQPCQQGRTCPANREGREHFVPAKPGGPPLQVDPLWPRTGREQAIAMRPFGMGEPVRAHWGLPWAACFLALQFVLGWCVGVVCTLWWLA